jgi:Icc-related predicted phosphoesterase
MKTKHQNSVRLAAMGDLHYTKMSHGHLQPIFEQVADNADILLLCGDLVDYGLPEETEVLAKELSVVKIPTLAVLGNHELESGKQAEVQNILAAAGVNILDGNACEVHGIGFAGVKGFAGGFGQHSLQPWGEPAIKKFVQESIDEALKLESALAKLRTQHRIALLHYSPIQATVEGEPQPIYPFLGSSRLEEPLNRYGVTAVFHGHAHHGRPEGRTQTGVPVYNVAIKVLKQHFPDRPVFRLVEIPAEQRADEGNGMSREVRT